MSFGLVVNAIVNFWRDKMNRKEKEKVQVVIYQLTNLLQRDKEVQIPAEGVLEFLVDLKPKEFD